MYAPRSFEPDAARMPGALKCFGVFPTMPAVKALAPVYNYNSYHGVFGGLEADEAPSSRNESPCIVGRPKHHKITLPTLRVPQHRGHGHHKPHDNEYDPPPLRTPRGSQLIHPHPQSIYLPILPLPANHNRAPTSQSLPTKARCVGAAGETDAPTGSVPLSAFPPAGKIGTARRGKQEELVRGAKPTRHLGFKGSSKLHASQWVRFWRWLWREIAKHGRA